MIEHDPDLSEPVAPLAGYHPAIQLIYRVVEMLAAIILASYVLAIFVQVVLRYVFNTSLFWTEELVRFGLVWNVMLGSALISLRSAHIRVDIIETFLSSGAKQVLRLINDVICLIFSCLLLYFGVVFMLKTAAQKSPVTNLPMGLAYASIAVGAALLVLFTGVVVMRRIRGREVDVP